MPVPAPFDDRRPALVGMVHLPALPGAPAHRDGVDAILARAVADTRALVAAGFDGVLVENFGDAPFHPDAVPPETVATLALAVAAAREVAGARPVGVNVLRNDARAALGVAAATGAAFIRVNVHAGTMWTDQGPLVGRAWETVRARRALSLACPILADVHVKHATPPAGASLEDAARDLWHRSGAGGIVVSGSGTGHATDPDRVARVRRAVPEAPIWVGSGATPDTSGPLVEAGANGLIVGSWVQVEGRAGGGVDPERARAFVETCRAR